MIALACVDGGLLCGPLAFALLGGLFAWFKCRGGACGDHDHDH